MRFVHPLLLVWSQLQVLTVGYSEPPSIVRCGWAWLSHESILFACVSIYIVHLHL
jgi:hypothetical protein